MEFLSEGPLERKVGFIQDGNKTKDVYVTTENEYAAINDGKLEKVDGSDVKFFKDGQGQLNPLEEII